MVTMVTSRKNRTVQMFRNPHEKLFVVEGEKLISEALEAGLKPQAILAAPKQTSIAIFRKLVGKCTALIISESISEYVSDTKSPQGLFALFAKQHANINFGNAHRLILLDGIRDPGNVGAVLRSCEAFGIEGAVLSDRSADMFGGKVVRAAAGSTFRLPMLRECLESVIPKLKKFGFAVWAADLDADAVKIQNADFSGKCAIVIGSEGQGVSESVKAICDGKVYIPIRGAESLNAAVAAGIMCYELGKANSFCGIVAD